MFGFLKGKRTYITSFCLAVLVFLKQVGILPEGLFEPIAGILGASGLTFLRAAIK